MAVNSQSAGVLQVMCSKPWLDVACVPIPALETKLLEDQSQTHNRAVAYHHVLELLICTMPKEGAIIHAELTSAAVGFLSSPSIQKILETTHSITSSTSLRRLFSGTPPVLLVPPTVPNPVRVARRLSIDIPIVGAHLSNTVYRSIR